MNLKEMTLLELWKMFNEKYGDISASWTEIEEIMQEIQNRGKSK